MAKMRRISLEDLADRFIEPRKGDANPDLDSIAEEMVDDTGGYVAVGFAAALATADNHWKDLVKWGVHYGVKHMGGDTTVPIRINLEEIPRANILMQDLRDAYLSMFQQIAERVVRGPQGFAYTLMFHDASELRFPTNGEPEIWIPDLEEGLNLNYSC